MSDKGRSLKVTIMIPTYNQEGFILDAVNSALAQTYPRLEVIVGDDASSDDTFRLVSSIRDARLKYVRNKINLGRHKNYKNILCNHATGDFVVNLDGDDYFTDNNFISEAIKLIDADKKVVMVVAKVTTKKKDSEYVSKIPCVNETTGMQILKKLPDNRYNVMHMGVLYARKKAIDIDFYRSPVVSSDWESIYRLSLRGTVKYLNRNIGIWRIHGENETRAVSVDKLYDNLSIWQSIYDDAQLFGMSPLLGNFLCARCIAKNTISSCVVLLKARRFFELLKFFFFVLRKYQLAIIVLFVFAPKYAVMFVGRCLRYFHGNALP